MKKSLVKIITAALLTAAVIITFSGMVAMVQKNSAASSKSQITPVVSEESMITTALSKDPHPWGTGTRS